MISVRKFMFAAHLIVIDFCKFSFALKIIIKFEAKECGEAVFLI